MSKHPAQNSGKNSGGKRGRTENLKPFKKGQSGNPGGRPKNEQSISHWINEFGNRTPAELADLCTQYAADLKKVKGDMPMFAHIAIRALMGQINEPSPGLFAIILDRTEGKVKDRLELSGDVAAPVVLKVVYSDKK
jgi:hypothetical protein